MKYYLNKKSTIINNILYKYLSIEPHLTSLLTNHELWFSDPYCFNDPYDCNLRFNLDNIEFEEVYDYLISANELVEKKMTQNDLKKRAEHLFNNPLHLEEIGELSIRDEIRNKGIYCLSEADDVLLMWSHYANCHKGVCLTFDLEKDRQLFFPLFKVEYPDLYPCVNPLNRDPKLQFMLATKSHEWRYEKEVRIVKDKRDGPYRGLIKYNPNALTEIKFGYKASQEEIDKIKLLVKELNLNIKLFTSVLKKNEFGLEFNEISNS